MPFIPEAGGRVTMVKTVLCDLIGTIITQQPDQYWDAVASSELPNKQNFERTARSVYTMHPGLSLMEFTDELSQALSGKKNKSLKGLLLSLWRSTIENSRLLEGAFEVLIEMSHLGYKMVAVSNTIPVMHEVIRKLGLNTIFDSIILSCDVGMLKPSIRIFEIALQSVGGTSEYSCMIGDTWETDIVGALDANCMAVFVDKSLTRHDESASRGVVHIPSIEFARFAVQHLFKDRSPSPAREQ